MPGTSMRAAECEAGVWLRHGALPPLAPREQSCRRSAACGHAREARSVLGTD